MCVMWIFKKILLEHETAWSIINFLLFDVEALREIILKRTVVRQNREKLSGFTVARLRHPVLPVSRSNLFEIAAQTRGVTCVRAKPGSLKFTTLNFKVATSVVLIIVARIPPGIFVTDNILLWKDYVWSCSSLLWLFKLFLSFIYIYMFLCYCDRSIYKSKEIVKMCTNSLYK